MILALINSKGGVGKTLTATSLAAGLAAKGLRTLLVDLDSQGSASLALGVGRVDLSPSIADVLLDGSGIGSAIRRTGIEGLDLITGSMDLANADLALADKRGREGRLKAVLEPIRDDYPFVILDSPPSMSLLPVNALVAADNFIVPVVPQYLALEGLVNLLEAVGRIRAGIGTVADLLGLVLTIVDYRTRAATEIVQLIRAHYGSLVFRSEIRINTKLTEAPSFGKTVFEYAGSSTAAEAYRELTVEVLNRCRKKGRKP